MISGTDVDGVLAHRWRTILAEAGDWMPPPVPTVLVVPHPDDESLMFGGLVAHQRARGVAVSVVAVTDGERSYPGLDPATVASTRRVEQSLALARLGVEPSAVTRLGLPDGEVSAHEDGLADTLAGIVAGHRLVVAPWPGDHHCDHEATGRAAAAGAGRAGVDIAFGLFWTWHHVDPARLAGASLGALRLDPDGWRRRMAAVRAHRSQVGTSLHDPPMLSPADLEPVRWRSEHYVLDPASS